MWPSRPAIRDGRGGDGGRWTVRTRAVTAASVAMALTAPGQTAAVSVFVDPIITELGLSRTAVSTAYLAGTLVAALAMPALGSALDRWGPRRLMLGVAAAFGAILVASSAMSGPVGLVAGFVGIRLAGQGALNLVATTTVALYVSRRRGSAIGLASAIGTAGISLAPLLLERLIAGGDWRTVWFFEGVAVWAVVIPVTLLVLPRRPVAVSAPAPAEDPDRPGDPSVDWTPRRAMGTGMFWVVAAGVGACSLVATGLNFHQQSLLGERGLSPAAAAATFLPQTAAGLVATFALGWLADRFSDRLLIVLTMVALALATVGAGWLGPGAGAIGYALAIGACGNGVRTLEAVAFPRLFGLTHLGAIRGIVHAVAVASSAFGPVLLALGRGAAGSYRPVLLAFALLPVIVVVAALVTPDPRPTPAPRSPVPSGET